MYRAVVATRMRPFDVCARGRRRQVRDLARGLGKKARLEVVGRDTEVDGDIVDRLDAPISHLLRNALDHGLERSTERLKVGKSEVGKVTLEARHTAGKLVITVSDDGAGIDPDRLVAKVLAKNLATSEMVAAMSPEELLDFLFLPGFSTRETVSAVSGRGVGLDAVRSAVEEMGGTLSVVSSLGRGTTFSLNLPLTRSVMRTLLVEVNGEPFAIPLARIDHVLQIDMDDVEVVEARQYYSFEGANIGLVAAHQVLELGHHESSGGDLSVVVISDQVNRYGLVVDRFLGEQDLVVRPIDKILGKIQDISAMAVSADGEPVHIIDVDDLVRSIDALITGRSLRRLERTSEETRAGRVLVVDDSIIVRELQKQLLEIRGFEVDVAVDGMDGWNALRTDPYDLVITDIDMPRMNGFELVKEIKKDSTLRSIPVIIVSYKDREEDRLRGLEAGANYYLTKGSFHDETLVNAVVDLIGAPS